MSRDPARLWNAEMIAMKEKQGIPSDQLTNLDRICYEVKPELHLSYQMTEHMADCHMVLLIYEQKLGSELDMQISINTAVYKQAPWKASSLIK